MKLYFPLSFIAAMLLCTGAQAQCRTFVKNNCGEAMAGYVIGENFNAAKLMPGDEAEMRMTFSKGEDYRLLVCHQSVLTSVEFQILDSEKKVLFDNREHDLTNQFDFRVPGTQEFIIEVKAGKGSNSQLTPQGCVAVLVGKKVNP